MYSYLSMGLRDAPGFAGDTGNILRSYQGSSPRHVGNVQSRFDLPKRFELDLDYRYVSAPARASCERLSDRGHPLGLASGRAPGVFGCGTEPLATLPCGIWRGSRSDHRNSEKRIREDYVEKLRGLVNYETLRALKKNNIANQVIVARDGAEALDFLLGRGKFEGRDLRITPQVVLLDLKLPKVDGLEVLRQLRGHEPTKLLPVVILTSSNEEQDLLRGYELGANSYVRKPVDFNQFIEAVRQLGLYWLILNELPPARR
jgi:two-component system response regulator